MKSTLLVICLLITGVLFSQKIHLGAEVGANMVQIEKTKLGKDFQPGWLAGVAFEYDFLDWLSLKSGVYYSQKRQSYTSSDTSLSGVFALLGDFEIDGLDLSTYTNVDGRTAQHYFEIPIMANYKHEGFSAYVGGYFGFMFAARNRETITETTPAMATIDIASLDPTGFIAGFLPAAHKESFEETSSKTNLKVFDYGLKGGIGYQFNKIGVNVAYQLGIPDYRINKGSESKQNHHFFQFSVNYMFNLGKKKMGNSRL